VTQSLEASTECWASACGESSTQRTHFGFIYSQPERQTFLGQSNERAIPVLVEAETIDITLPPDAARKQLTQDLRNFLISVNFQSLTSSYTREYPTGSARPFESEKNSQIKRIGAD
jgi:hypothetical protein